MNEIKKERILQIIAPTIPVNAIFKNNDGPDEKYPVEIWALIEREDGETDVVGMTSSTDGMVSEVTMFSNFLGYELIKIGD